MSRETAALCFLLAAVAMGQYSHWPCSNARYLQDCSYRNLTVLPDIMSRFGSIWNLRGNLLRKLPKGVPYSVSRLDMSDTGLVGHVNLADLRVGSIHEYYVPRINYLDISFNHIKSLNTSILRSEKTVTLNASNNLIEQLETTDHGAFELEILRVANNRIREVPNGLSTTYPKLQFLDLSGNPLQVVAENAFENLNNLQVLRLDETGVLSTLLNDTFSNLVNLQYLHLAGNAFESLPSGLFENLTNLEVLQLQRNSLKSLPDDIFRNMFSLRMLILDDNRLDHLQDSVFAGLHSLEDLSVRGNQLTAVPSLHLCWGPLQRALFDDNLIQEVSEHSIRSLLRHGFRFGDLRGNSITNETLRWITNTSDVRIELKEFSSTISLCVKNSGEIVF